MNTSESILLNHRQGIATLTLNRPQARNALDVAMLENLPLLLEQIAADSTVRAVVITGAGTQAFCAGGDISGMDQAHPLAGDALAAQIARWARASVLLHTMPKPTLAVIDGVAAGAGMSLALACDLRLGTPRARFITAFARIGMSGDFGGSYFLTRLVGPARARELYLLSEAVGADAALALGLLNRLVPEEDLVGARDALLERLLAVPAEAIGHIKANLNLALEGDLARVISAEAAAMAHLSSSPHTLAASRQVLGKTHKPAP
ncbi:MAG: enoyl-CoA hydratase/isomerase family protein [Proteobacteria bacterium]|nr:enoyl-CoA hydratase/isomerase family protein [Pseudomonadota bacterium]HQR03231.1 enoyl-CoA hydratase-related protein [Rhodocyclaceae bacterium]